MQESWQAACRSQQHEDCLTLCADRSEFLSAKQDKMCGRKRSCSRGRQKYGDKFVQQHNGTSDSGQSDEDEQEEGASAISVDESSGGKGS